MKNRTLVHLLNNELRVYLFRLFFTLVGFGLIFHLGWTIIDQKNKENEIKNSIIKLLQEPFRKKSFLEIKNIANSYNHPETGIDVCIKFKNGQLMTGGNCGTKNYTKAEIPLTKDYVYISVNKKLDWGIIISYLTLFLAGGLVFIWAKIKLDHISRSIISDLKHIIDFSSREPFHYKELENAHHEIKKGREAIQKAEDLKKRNKLWELSIKLAHDVRQPLSAIKKTLYKLESTEETALISTSLQNVDTLVANLLNRYKNPNEQKIYQGTGDLVAQLKSTISLMRITDPELVITFDHPETALISSIPPADIRRIMNNLLKNSAEAMANRISISCDFQDGIARIMVVDNGKGIPAEMISSLFTKGMTNKQEGHGLGLFITKELLEKSHGSIQVDSKEGKGTMVHLKIAASNRLVLVDDSRLIRKSWEKNAKKKHHHLTTYANYQELFENIHLHHKHDFFFCDLIIQEKNCGWEASRKLYKLGFKNIYLQTAAEGQMGAGGMLMQ